MKGEDPPLGEYDWLDFTRIHPEHYKIAKKIALDEQENTKLTDNEAVLELIRHSQRLDDMELADYGKHLSQKAGSNMMATLEFIIKELKQPFEDIRKEFPTQSDDLDIFYTLTGESRYHLKEESIINVKVLDISDKGLKTITDSGVIGFIRPFNIKDNTREYSQTEL